MKITKSLNYLADDDGCEGNYLSRTNTCTSRVRPANNSRTAMLVNRRINFRRRKQLFSRRGIEKIRISFSNTVTDSDF